MLNEKIIKVMAALGVLTANLLTAGCQKPGNANNAIKAKPPEVGIVTVQPTRVELTTELPGRTSPYLVAEIRPQVSGLLKERLFNPGSDVQVGDLLYQIDPVPFQATYDSQQAALAKAEASLTVTRLRAGRLERLLKDNAVSRQDYDDAAAALQQAEADVAYWKAAMKTARINLAYTRVNAPIAGRIGRSNVTVGALVTAYQPAVLATIQQLDPIYVDVTQSSAELLRLNRNLKQGRLSAEGKNQRAVKLLLEDGTPYSEEGTLQFREVTVDPTTGSVTLRIVFSNPEFILLPGMFVRAVVQEGIADQAIVVPQQGITRDPKGNPVALVVDDAGEVQQRQLILERAIGDQWLVQSGLGAGDRLIVEGMQKVRPGASVTVVPFDTQKMSGMNSHSNLAVTQSK